jgi:4-hydroxy-tetrahydrodipicolinate reductase
MGILARAVVEAADDMTFVGGFARVADPSAGIDDDLGRLLDAANPHVLVDLTTHPSSVDVATTAVRRGVHVVIGASGWLPDEREALAALAQRNSVGALLLPNFAIGAVLMMRFAEEAARFFPTVEIVETHHEKKLDAPSGTARITAERIEAVRGAPVPIHSVRLRGVVAQQEVLFGGQSETLTIRHEAISRDAFAPGIALAIRAVTGLVGLTIGLPLPEPDARP